VSVHWAVGNSAALRRLGYSESSVPPAGGKLGRDADGRLDGRLYERAQPFGRSGTAFPERTLDDRLLGLQRTQRNWHAAGLTSVCDALVTPDDIRLLQTARHSGWLSLRTSFLLDAAYYEQAHALGITSGFGDDRLRFAGLKTFVDGAVGGRTCHLSEPFLGTDDVGLQITDTDVLREILTAAHHDGTTTAVHANGDAAIRLLLDLHEEIARARPRPRLRHRIEHCSVVDDQILERISRLGLMVLPFAGYAGYYGGLLERWYGRARVGRMFAHRSFLDRGITVGGSSDYPCGPFQPLVGIQSMVTRRGIDDGALAGPQQRITPAEALSIYTLGSAMVCGEERTKGRLAPGYLADLVVLGDDPLSCAPDDIADIPVLSTFVGGNCVWPT
jgi:predicted amidohydrolase YtcJ